MTDLFLPSPTMALMIGARSYTDTWMYTDLLSDRLQVMMPLVPGFVMSLVSGSAISEGSLRVLGELISAIGGSFHRVFAVLMQNLMGAQGRKTVPVHDHEALVKAASDYVPPLVLISAWIEHHIRKHETTQDCPTVVYKPVRPQRPKDDAEGSWVEVAPAAFPDRDEDVVLDPQLENQIYGDDSALLKKLRSSQKSVLSMVTDLIGNTMKMGGAESSTCLWHW